MHITIDGFGASSEKLASEDFVRETLDTIPNEMGWTKIGVPNVFKFERGKPEDWGVSGFVLIAESHIAIHTFPRHGQIWVDVFSTKDYNSDKFAENIATRFESEEVRTHRFEHGLQYPHNGEGDVPGPKELGEERNNWRDRITDQQNQKER